MLAAYSATALQRTTPSEQTADDTPATQTSNRATKTNRLVQTAFAAISPKPVFALASVVPDLLLEQARNPVIAAIPPIPGCAGAPSRAARP